MQNLQKKKKGTAGFLSVIVPGSGHLYLGLNKQGLQLMVLFFGALALHLPFTSILLPVVWFYALFDVLQKTDRYNHFVEREQERTATGTEDLNSIPGAEDLTNPNRQSGSSARPASAADVLEDRFWFDWPKSDINLPMWVGILILLIGGYTLLSAFYPHLNYLLARMHLGTVVVAVLLIGFGLRMILTQRRDEDR